MDIKEIVPHVSEDGQFSMSAAEIFYAVINKIHFERRVARDIGWRGILPCPGQEWTWTCRIFESDCIFGIVHCKDFFSQEEVVYPDDRHRHDFFASEPKNVWGRFALFVFPPHGSSLGDEFSLHALYLSEQADFSKKIREWSFLQNELAQFYVGDLYIGISVNNLCLRLETKERFCVIAANGVSYEEENCKKYVIEPMGMDANIPAYSVIRHLFDCIVRTFAKIFHCTQEDMICMMEKKKYSIPAYDDFGNLFQSDQEQTAIARTVQWGDRIWPESKDEKEDFFPLDVERKKGKNLPFVHILSGFLGAGKTTFLREWLAYLQNKDIYLGVIQNEFGKIGLDTFLLQGDTVVEAIDEGCVCCSLADALRPAIYRVLGKMPAKDILLETSGVANPLNVLQSMKDLDDLVQLGLVIVLVDAYLLFSKFENENFFCDGVLRSQIEYANVLVLNKIDLLPKDQEKNIFATLHKINKNALILKSKFGRIHFAVLEHALDEVHKNDTGKKILDFSLPYKKSCTHEQEGFESRIIFFRKISESQLKEILFSSHAVRAKGIVTFYGKKKNLVQFSSQRIDISSFEDENFFSDQDYIIFIGNKLNHAYLDIIEKMNSSLCCKRRRLCFF